MKKRIGTLIIVVALAASSALYMTSGIRAQNEPSGTDSDLLADEGIADQGHRHGPGSLFRRILSHLNLSRQQREQVRSIFEDERPRMARIMRRLRAAHLQSIRSMIGGRFDEERTRAIARLQGGATARMTVERARVWSQVYAILTPQQQAQADELLRRLLSHAPEGAEDPGAEEPGDMLSPDDLDID